MTIVERYAQEREEYDFRTRALTKLASAIEAKLNAIAPDGEQRQQNLEMLFRKELRANQWFSYFCPQECAPDFGESQTSFAMLYFTYVAGDIERFPVAFMRLWKEMDPKIK